MKLPVACLFCLLDGPVQVWPCLDCMHGERRCPRTSREREIRGPQSTRPPCTAPARGWRQLHALKHRTGDFWCSGAPTLLGLSPTSERRMELRPGKGRFSVPGLSLSSPARYPDPFLLDPVLFVDLVSPVPYLTHKHSFKV